MIEQPGWRRRLKSACAKRHSSVRRRIPRRAGPKMEFVLP